MSLFEKAGMAVFCMIALGTALVDCGDQGSASVLGATTATYYCEIAAAFPKATLEGFHLKNFSDKPVGVVFEKITVADSKNGKGGLLIWDFESDEGGEHYWGFDAGTKKAGAWSSGEVKAPASGGETYITGNASAAYGAGKYLVIEMKNFSKSVTGDLVTFVPIYVGDVVDPATQRVLKDIFKKAE